MKIIKSISVLLIVGLLSIGAAANGYRLNESKLDLAISQADDITESITDFSHIINSHSAQTAFLAGDKDSKFMFLALAFCLGQFGLHRYYAGVEGLKYLGFYFCTGGIVAKVDFADVLFNGSEFSDYGEDKFVIW